MNKMMMYAKVVTIRDKQTHQKKRLRSRFKEEEKAKDLMLEIERLKDIKKEQEKERRQKIKLKKDHDVIVR